MQELQYFDKTPLHKEKERWCVYQSISKL